MQEKMFDGKQRNGISKEEPKECVEIKITVTEMKNTSDGLISRLDMAKAKKISGLEGISREASKIEKQRKQRLKNTKYLRTVRKLKKL